MKYPLKVPYFFIIFALNSLNMLLQIHSWRVMAYLNNSFSFLITKPEKVPDSIKFDKELFFNFLAGLIDSDGSINLVCGNRLTSRIVIYLTDIKLLKDIKKQLQKFDYNPFIFERKKESKIHFGKKVMYELIIDRKKEVKLLLQQIPFRHQEKIEKANLILKLKGDLLVKKWKKLSQKIKQDVIRYKLLASKNKKF